MSTPWRALPVTGMVRSNADHVADELLELYLDPGAREMQHIGSYELPNDAQVEHVIEMRATCPATVGCLSPR